MAFLCGRCEQQNRKAMGEVIGEEIPEHFRTCHVKSEIDRLRHRLETSERFLGALRRQVENEGYAVAHIGEKTYECDATDPCRLCRLRNERDKLNAERNKLRVFVNAIALEPCETSLRLSYERLNCAQYFVNVEGSQNYRCASCQARIALEEVKDV